MSNQKAFEEFTQSLGKLLNSQSKTTSADLCTVLAEYGYANRNCESDHINNTFTQIVGMLISYMRFCEIMGFNGKDGETFDPAPFVAEFENTPPNYQDHCKHKQFCQIIDLPNEDVLPLEDMLIPALRQYRHNDNSGFVTGYNRSDVLQLLNSRRFDVIKLTYNKRKTDEILMACSQLLDQIIR